MARNEVNLYPGKLLWAGLSLVGIVDAIWLLATPIDLGIRPVLIPGAVAVACLAWVAINRLFGLTQGSRNLAIGIAFIMIGWPTLIVLNHLTMSLPIPFADERLAGWDRAIGFDWLAYLALVTERPWLQNLLDWSYAGLSNIAVGVFVILFFTGQERAREFVEVFFFAALVTVLLGALFPALTAFPHHQPPEDMVKLLPRGTGMSHVGPMAGLRSGETHVIAKLPGIVAFPSFHTAGALIIAYCCRGTRFLFIPAALFAATTIAATPVFGGHYLVDVIAGFAVALVCILFYRSRFMSRSLRAVEAQA